MSAYNPPIENVPIFDSALFRGTNSETTLTTKQADRRYLRFPIAQGNETLQGVVVSGTAQFNSTANFNTTSTFVGDAQFNSNVSIGSPLSFNNDPIINLNKSSLTFTGGGTANFPVPVNISGVSGSLNLTTTNANLTANATIQQSGSTTANNFGVSTFNGNTIINNKTLDIDGVSGQIRYADTTTQVSAYTGASALTGSYTNTNMTIDSNGKITALANGSGGGGGGNYTYTQKFNGNYPSGLSITIPSNCVKFDVVLVGTGGTTVNYTIGVPDGSHPDYYYKAPATGGGPQVVKSSVPLNIPKQGVDKTSTMLLKTNTTAYIYSGGNVTQLLLDGFLVVEAGNGNAGSTFDAGTATTATPYTNPKYTSWVITQGTVGQANSESDSSPNTGQLGGGNVYGGIAGNISGGNQNTFGQGQLYGALSGPSYGVPIYPASPINYGGAYITWYIQK